MNVCNLLPNKPRLTSAMNNFTIYDGTKQFKENKLKITKHVYRFHDILNLEGCTRAGN